VIRKTFVTFFLKSFFVLWIAFWAILFPPQVYALIKVNNWAFASDATSWTSTNDNGTNLCADNGSSTGDQAFDSFAYNANVSGRTAYRAQAQTLILTTEDSRGMITQNLAIPGSGTVKAAGRFRYFASSDGWGGANTSWIRMDVYDSTNTTFVASLGCVSFNSNQAWTQTSSQEISLTGGTTYTLRVTMRSRTIGTALIASTITLGVDDIEVNVAPTGLSLSQSGSPVDSSWSTSTAGTGAPGLHSTEAYEIARHTSSPVAAGNIIASTTSTSYADSGTSPNTTYYYAVFDKDTSSNRSPPSAEQSILTKPGVPTGLNVSGSTETGISLAWTAPSGGATSYVVQRAPDVAGSPGSYSEIANSITPTSYTNSGLSCSQTYWYRVAAVNSSGSSSFTSGVQGQTLYCISITLDTDGTINFGTIALNVSRNTTASGLNDPQRVTPEYGAVDVAVKTTNFTHGGNTWSLGSDPGNQTVKWEYSSNGSSWSIFNTADLYNTLISNTASQATAYFRLTTPTGSASFGPYSATVTVQATRP
jgi:hypothetical protein